MANAFSIYWTPNGWKHLPDGEPVGRAFGTGFSGKIVPGDRVFITNVKSGQLRLLGGFTVGAVGKTAELPPSQVTWGAPEYLAAAPGTSAPLKLRAVDDSVVNELRFLTGGAASGSVARDPNGVVNGQTMRANRQLTADSANLLDSLLQSEEAPWRDDELRSAVKAYVQMRDAIAAGQSVVKAKYYRELAARFGRSESAFEYRLRNISYLLSLMGRAWIPGLLPAKNVGPDIGSRLQKLLAELEGRTVDIDVGTRFDTARLRGRVARVPNGNRRPQLTTRTSTTYSRDADVRAWVLDNAAGLCEVCGCAAPFEDVDGYPFLEVHHVKHLADGGSDTPQNAIAACPNCHRRLHFSSDAPSFRESLFSRVSRLVRE